MAQYVQEFNPLYSASKAGILSFVRSVASQYWSEGIRINAICPGSVRTPLVSGKVWDLFPQEYMTPVETIVSTVRMLIDGGDITDSEGCTVTAGNVYGLAVEIFVRDIFFRVQAPYISEAMRQICEAASVKNQKGNLKD
jgi:NAD(P)-dependent dehydrogenase (short-subunit alcohol dehydrogenase family)